MQSSATMWLGSMWSAKRAWCMSLGQRIKGTPTSWRNSTQAITSDLSCRFPPSGILMVVLWIRHWGPTRTSCFTLEVSIYLAFESSVQYNIAVSYLTCLLLYLSNWCLWVDSILQRLNFLESFLTPVSTEQWAAWQGSNGLEKSETAKKNFSWLYLPLVLPSNEFVLCTFLEF